MTITISGSLLYAYDLGVVRHFAPRKEDQR
jgi:hypothetical protein